MPDHTEALTEALRPFAKLKPYGLGPDPRKVLTAAKENDDGQ